jgi:hypothetical protein
MPSDSFQIRSDQENSKVFLKVKFQQPLLKFFHFLFPSQPEAVKEIKKFFTCDSYLSLYLSIFYLSIIPALGKMAYFVLGAEHK